MSNFAVAITFKLLTIMMKENTVKIFEQSFKDNWDRPCLTDYNTKETITYADFARDIAFRFFRLFFVFLQRKFLKKE